MTTGTENWYTWKEWVETSGKRRLVSPEVHGRSFDDTFPTAQEAFDFKLSREEADGKEWVLVKVTVEPVEHEIEQLLKMSFNEDGREFLQPSDLEDDTFS